MIEEELAYIAGFWEGEGHAGLISRGRNKPKRLEVGITQKNFEVLFFIKNFFGCGHIRHHSNGIYQWRTRNKGAKDFLRRIYPFTKFRDKHVLALMI